RQVAEPPLRQVAGVGSVAVHGLDWIACNEQARPGDLFRGCDRVSDPLVRSDRAEREQRAPVVATLGIARENRMRNDHRLDTELGEPFAPTLPVDDDAVEAAATHPPG